MFILRAIGDLIEKQDELTIFETAEQKRAAAFLIFGICLRALSGENVEITTNVSEKLIIINVIKSVLLVEFSGPECLKGKLFQELLAILDRLIQVDNDTTRLSVLEILDRIVKQYPATFLYCDLDDVENAQCNQILRLLMHTLAVRVPSLLERPFALGTFPLAYCRSKQNSH